jgi:TonB family protein
MKKAILMTALFTLVGFSVLHAKDRNKAEESKESMVKETILHKISYPAFASEQNIEGDVYVSLTIDKDGKVNILRTNSAIPELKDCVVEQLQKMKFETENIEDGKVFNFKFTFKLY